MRWSAEFGEAVGLRFGPQRVLLLTSPRATADVLEREAGGFRKAPVISQLAVPVIGHSLFTAEGVAWRRQRELVEPALAPDRLGRHLGQITAAFEGMSERWRTGQAVEATDEMMAVSQRIAWRILFGADASQDDIDRTRAALIVTSTDFEERLNHPLAAVWPAWLPTRAHRRLRAAVGELDRLAYGLIDRYRLGEIDGGEALASLLAAQPTAPWLTDRLVRDNVVTMIVDGRENPGLLLTWALYELARRPDLAERAALEARRMLETRGGDTDTSFRDLPVIRAVLDETLRLHPPAYATGRVATRDCRIDGIAVRRGTVVLVSPFIAHASPGSFDRPDLFRPERWLEARPEPLAPGAYAPFGLGPRRCPGESLALTIGLVGLAVMLARWQLEPVDPAPIEPMVRLSLRPSRDVRLRVTARP